jgi:hypothetical protein
MKITAARFAVRLAVVAVACGVAVGLTGCLQSSTSLPGSRPTDTPSPSGSSATATPVPTPTPTSDKVVEDCNILFTPAQVYAYNPNFVRETAYVPKPGSVPAAIAAVDGQTCGWLNESSGSKIEVGLAIPTTAQWTAAKAAASSGTPLDEAGYHGFFAVKDGAGSAQFFFGSIWLDVSSADFETAADASPVYSTIVQNQVHAGG